MNNQLNFDHLKDPKSLEAGRLSAGNTKEGCMEKMGLELWLKGEEAAWKQVLEAGWSRAWRGYCHMSQDGNSSTVHQAISSSLLSCIW